ncbi:MAG TPA: FHA domain-containing protein [Candidatus Limnocylindrales bacterium]|nr:FHA domain-containing protein [Candidatus Limnocylindrales bacterium]
MLLWAVRIAFVVVLYLFLVRAFAALWRAMRSEEAAATRPGGIAYLVVQRSHRGGPPVGDRLPLRAVSAIGRDAGNDVVVNDEAASARHATLSFSDGEWWIDDLQSTNGTLLNGARVEKRERMYFGDEIEIGRIALRLEQA